MEIRIENRKIGPGRPVFIIAEAGVNHDGDPAKARQLVAAAAAAGADAVKFQTFTAEGLVTRTAPKARYQRLATDPGESQYEMLRRLELSAEAHAALFQCCGEEGIIFLSSPFDRESCDLLETLGAAAYKIGSGELTNHPLLAHAAAKGRPLIISTGMATLNEVEAAVTAVETRSASRPALLHCVSEYPAPPSHVNLRAMRTLADRFNVPTGYSDHTTGIEVALAAAALGACIIEKHITLDRSAPGPDHAASLDPLEFKELVAGIRKVESALGNGIKRPTPKEGEIAAVARKSLVAATDLSPGTPVTGGMIAIKRPGTGLPPSMKESLMGRRVGIPVKKGTLITMEMFL